MEVAVVVNARARRGGELLAERCAKAVPGARIALTRSLDEVTTLARELALCPPDLLVAAGGDGTAIGLLNALRAHAPEVGWPWRRAGAPATVLAMLPLGTGNAWARVTGAVRWPEAIAKLGGIVARAGERGLPRRTFDLVEVDGMLGHFAGTGWDAEIIDDFHAQKQAVVSWLPESRRSGVWGYLNATFTRTIPRQVFTRPSVEVEIVNEGAPALGVDEAGRPFAIAGCETGGVVYRGKTSVCAAATTQEWGYGFRAFPFAGLVPRTFSLRVYTRGAVEAGARVRQLWRGVRVPGMHDWLLTRCRATFSQPVPFQIAGDRTEHKTEVVYRVAPEQVDLLDWGAS